MTGPLKCVESLLFRYCQDLCANQFVSSDQMRSECNGGTLSFS